MATEESFFGKLAQRRIPQVLGIYLAGSWTALEFSQWAVSRFALSPHWEELTLLILLILLPTVLVLAWHHGAPGRQPWSLFERIFIPLNLLALPLILFYGYADKDLGKVVSTVMVRDAEGQTQTRVVAKSEFTTSLIVFPFRNLTGDPDLDFLSTASSEVLARDLGQSIFMVPMDVFMISKDIQRAGKSPAQLPLSLQLSLADKINRPFLINGSITREQDEYRLSATVYNVRNGKRVAEAKAADPDYFAAMDRVTETIMTRIASNVPEYIDYPIGDLYTDNWAAFRDYSLARALQSFGEQQKDAQPLYLSALERDPTFSYAAYITCLYLLQQNRVVEALKYARLAQQQRDYRLLEREKLSLTATQYFLDKQGDKAFATLDQWITLYPQDWMAYYLKAAFSLGTKRFDDGIANLKKVMEIDPSQQHHWDTIGDTYRNIGRYSEALDAYNRYAEAFPSNPVAYKNMGDLLRQQGKQDQAISNYQRALTLAPQDINVLWSLALTWARSGDFDEAEKLYQSALEQSRTPQDHYDAQLNLATFYWQFGKWQAAKALYLEAYADGFNKLSQGQSIMAESMNAWRYFLAGDEALAEATIDKSLQWADEHQEELIRINILIGKAELLNHQGQADQALELFDSVYLIARQYLENRSDVEIDYLKGRSWLALQEYDKAIAAFEPMMELYPDNLEVLEWPARAHLEAGHLEQAESLYRSILDMAPGYPEYNLAMAELLTRKQDFSGAKTFIDKALSGWQHADMEFPDLRHARKLLEQISAALN